MTAGAEITAVVANYRTLALTRTCVETLVEHYPSLPLILIDNGSGDESTEYVREAEQRYANVRAILNPRNRYHGPALDQGVRSAATRYVFTLDSDCEIQTGGFLEQMIRQFEDQSTYAVGELRYKNRFGFTYGYEETAQAGKPGRIPYIHPYAMLLDRDKYLRLRPFIHHGAPCIRNMEDAQRSGFRVVNFPIHEYVLHRLAGTSEWQGYGLRLAARQRVEYYLNRITAALRRDPTMPFHPPRDGGE
jgi:glycosyltransferase involved in cell wall biosynthesis